MRTSIFSSPFTLLLSLTLFLAGCRQDPGALAPVTGRVTFKGVPLTSGLIVFTPDASKGETGPIAFSVIREDGTFTLSTGDAQGAQAGWYRVTVSAQGPANSQPGQAYSVSESIIPEKYLHPDSSELTCKVAQNQDNSFEFNLSADRTEKSK